MQRFLLFFLLVICPQIALAAPPIDPEGRELVAPLLLRQNSTPSNPAASKYKLYPKSDGKLYLLNNSGAELPFVTESGTATLTNKTFDADGSGNSITNIENADIKAGAAIARNKLASGSNSHVIINDGSGVMSSEATLAKSRGGSGQDNSSLTFPASGTLATTAGTETFTNKTLTSPTINTPTVDIATYDGQASTPSSPSSGFYKLYFKDTDGKPYFLDSSGNEVQVGTGSGAGGINHITNGDAETATTGWAIYLDAASASPTDGTAGSPGSGLQISRITSGERRGNASFRLTKDASNRQGWGVSYDFFVDKADHELPQVQTVEFEYYPGSGFLFNGGTLASPSDISVWMYAKDSGRLIPMSSQYLSGSGKFIGTFQPLASDDDYRLILHVGTTNATAWTFDFDSVKVGPTNVARGPPMSNWTSYTPTLNATTNVSYREAFWRQVGDSIEIAGRLTYSGVGDNSAITIALPSGLAIDTAKLATAAAETTPLGQAMWFDTGTGVKDAAVVYKDTTSVYINGTGTNGAINSNTMAASDRIEFTFKVPITGWSSNQAMSVDDGRYYFAKLGGSTTAISSSGSTIYDITFAGINRQTHGGVTTTGMTIPVTGFYRWRAGLACGSMTPGGTASIFDIYLRDSGNNSLDFQRAYFARTNTGEYHFTGSGTVYLNAGTVVKLSSLQNSGATCTINGGSSGSFENYFTLESADGKGQVLVPQDAVRAIAQSDAGQSITTSVAALIFEDEIEDTHSAYNPATGVFTAPRAGTVTMCVAMLTNAVNLSTAQTLEVVLQKNGTTFTYPWIWGAGVSRNQQIHACGEINANRGDTFSASGYSAVSTSAHSNGSLTRVSFSMPAGF